MCVCTKYHVGEGGCNHNLPKFITYSYFETLQKQKGKSYEIVYRDYRQQHPWGTIPEDEWQNSECNYPDGLRDLDGYTRIPINAVCHVTHNKEAASIQYFVETQQCYTFIPAAKLGKQYGDDRLPLGETYRHIERRIFSKVPRSQDDPVFPGYYCWWGLSTTEWYKESGENLLSITRSLDVEVAEFAAHPPKSRYGNNAFTIGFSELLVSYRRSRTDIQERNNIIYLRVGGTLRYKYEVCYVVIVCLQPDHCFDDLDTIDKQDIIDHKGLVDRGKVVDYQKTPEFKAKYIISNMKNQSFSWEQVVFALYYPSKGFTLRCNKDEITQRNIEHRFCISTRSVPGGSRLCPNQIY